VSDLDEIVAQAWQGRPAALVDAINMMRARIAATENRIMKMADLPESAQEFFRAIGSVSRTRGRPSKANARLLELKRAYDRAAARWVFDQKRAAFAFATRSGAQEVIGRDTYPLPDMKPSDHAVEDMADETGLSEGTLLDLIYPDRHKRK
jgi:hypothetical protein